MSNDNSFDDDDDNDSFDDDDSFDDNGSDINKKYIIVCCLNILN